MPALDPVKSRAKLFLRKKLNIYNINLSLNNFNFSYAQGPCA